MSSWAGEINPAPTKQKMSKHYTGLAMHGVPKYEADAKHLDYANENAPKGGTLKMAWVGTFDTLNPFSIKGIEAQGLPYIYDRLMARVWDEPFTLYPLIAQSVDVPNDRSSIRVHLNPKARFQDNSQITADDVLFSFETLRKFGRPNMRRIYKMVKIARIEDQSTVYFELGPEHDRETVMILAMMPILSKKWWEGRNFEETILDPPLTSGPYKIKEVQSPHRIIYKRDENYWAQDLFPNVGHNNFDEIDYEYYRDDMVALEALKKSDLNLRRELDLNKWQTSYNNINSNLLIKSEIPHKRPEKMQGFIFNMRRTPFEDYRVRKALFLAFDDQWIGKSLFHGEFNRINSFFPNASLDGSGPLTPQERSKLEEWKQYLRPEALQETINLSDSRPLRQRLREADQLLKEAGWIVKNQKRINQKTGKNLSFEVITDSPGLEKIAITYAKTLEKLGIQMSIRVLDSANFLNRKKNFDYDILAFHWLNSLSPGTEQMIYWSCESVNQIASFNFSGICNPALDHFAKDITQANTYEELTQSAHAIDRILLSENIAIPLFYKGVDRIAHHPDIMHPETIPLYGVVMETWWMKPSKTSNSGNIQTK